MYHIGIDGGGTHTRVEIRDEHNRFLRRASFGAFNPAAIGEDAFRLRLREIFADIGDMHLVKSLCVGGAGSSGGTMDPILRQELERVGFCGTLTLCGDHEIALAGAMDSPGCILIAGTGSICFGRNAQGQTARCGGWGHLLDDCGSAYALGREALSAALRTEDGRLPANRLHRAVMAHLNAECAGDIIRFAYRGVGKAEIAALAPLVLQCAAEKEPTAEAIAETQAQELALMAQTTAKQLGLNEPAIALLGGLLEGKNAYSQLVKARIRAFARVVPPAHDALWGAAELAYRSVK